jgi:hypothetical protein
MGYWKQGEDGHSFALDSELIWGDSPADIMGAALKEIIAVFHRDRGRLPSENEIKAGLLFSLRAALAKAEGSFIDSVEAPV